MSLELRLDEVDELRVLNGGNDPTECSLTQLLMAKQHIFRSTQLFIWLQVKNKGLVLVKTVAILHLLLLYYNHMDCAMFGLGGEV